MRSSIREELRIFGVYFLIALTAEIAGFFGWLSEMTKGGNIFQLSTAFWNHELSRLWVWVPVFLGLSALRLLVVGMTGSGPHGKGVHYPEAPPSGG